MNEGKVFTEMSASFIFDVSEWNIGKYLKQEIQDKGKQILQDIIEKKPDIIEIREINNNGDVSFSYSDTSLAYPNERINQELLTKILNQTLYYEDLVLDDKKVYDIYYVTPDLSSARRDVIEYSTDKIRGIINIKYEYSKKIKVVIIQKILNEILIFLIFLLISTFLVVIFSEKITRPILKFKAKTKEIVGGKYNIKTNISSNDEIGDLAISFDTMAEDLKKNQEQLKQYNETLEEKVKDRTKELSLKVRELNKAKRNIEQFNKNLDSMVKKRTSELEKANIQVKNLLNVRSQFINQVAHDLRTPLTPISLLIPLAVKDIKSRKYSEAAGKLKRVTNNIEYLSYLVTETLNISKIDSGNLQLNKEKIELQKLISSVIEANETTLTNQKIKVHFVKSSKPVMLFIDKMRIYEVLNNLLINSTKYIGTKKKQITFSITEKRSDVEISISDTGIGIAKENLNKIFVEFFKIDDSRHDAAASSGLGLSICKRLIDLHHGKIWAESKGLGKGTTFFITLPKK
ncbi:HAMP domain-containing protein [Candidatus Woesearchaeota archaeon]|nr:HAMP domain-containing protein [Candidatus Woesearchaeota archaeon]